jgi:hypothetical protein
MVENLVVQVKQVMAFEKAAGGKKGRIRKRRH